MESERINDKPEDALSRGGYKSGCELGVGSLGKEQRTYVCRESTTEKKSTSIPLTYCPERTRLLSLGIEYRGQSRGFSTDPEEKAIFLLSLVTGSLYNVTKS